MSLPSADVAICGGGIVGLATAHAIATQTGRSVTVFEKEDRVAAHQSGRNSGVIHSGVYYPPTSDKANFVRAGRQELFDFCDDADVKYDICGKVIVATDSEEVQRLLGLASRAESNGIEARLIDRAELSEIEPHAAGVQALSVPSAGIIDYSKVCVALAKRVNENGSIVLGTAVTGITNERCSVRVTTTKGDASFGHFINCAGLQADRVAELSGATDSPMIVPFRGEFFNLNPLAGSLVNNLIYPVPDPRYPFLGVHLTRSIDGTRHCGPNALLALAREGYGRSDMNRRDITTLLRSRAFWKMGAKNWRSGYDELWRSLSKARFLQGARKLVPGLPDNSLKPAESGIRAQALDRNGKLLDDFEIQTVGRTISVLNAPSPAATASFAIGRAIAQLYVTALLDG